MAGRFAPVGIEPNGFDWPRGAPEDHGIDAGVLEALLAAATHFENLHAVVVVRHGTLVREVSFNGLSDEPDNVQSVTKSFTSALAGIAQKEGLIDFEQPVMSYLPEAFPGDNEPRRARIKVKHLLTMTSGLVMPDDASWVAAAQSADVVKAVLSAPMDAEPGTAFAYSTGVSHVMAAVLERVTGRPLDAWAREKLFNPLGVQLVGWATDRNGVTQGGSSMVLRPRDLARFGELYLRGGTLAGASIVPATWVSASTSLQINAGAFDYGAYWWLMQVSGHRAFEARGHGGQIILVVPDLELVVVVTANPAVNAEVGNSMLDTAHALATAIVGTAR